PRMGTRDPQPLFLPSPAVLLPPRQTALLLAQVSQVCLIALRMRDLLPRRERRQMRQSQVHPHRALHDRQPRRLDLRGETRMVASRGIARERNQVWPLDLRERLGELESTEFRQTNDSACPGSPHVLKAHTPGYTLALEPWVACTKGKEVGKRPILVPQALSEARGGHLSEPLVPGGTLPLRQPARQIIPGEPQSTLLVGFRADLEGGIPKPARGPEPAIEPTALGAVRIGANAVASRDGLYRRIMLLLPSELQAAFEVRLYTNVPRVGPQYSA